MSTQCFKLDGGRAVADVTARTLLVEGQPAKLGGRAFDLLLTLIEHRDRVMSKQELLDLVWPGLVVEENNLQVQVVALRKLLGSAAIATVSGRGYRLAAHVEEASAAARSDAAATRGAPAPVATSLPAAPASLAGSPLIGRDALLEEVTRQLDEPGTRWLTLLGPGGSGKTRLALVAAAARADRHPDGVWSVMLAGVRDPAQVPSAVAATLGLQESAAQTAADQLRDFLRHRQALLVLDNLEHLLPQAGATLLRLLDAGAGVQVLATSRLALQAAAERTLDVPPLALPPPGDGTPGDSPRSAPALRLLAERARVLGHPLRDQPGAWRAAASICRRLDGLPLAIELAAARLRTLTPEALAARLEQSLGLLRTGDAAAPERHQTLRATIAWSHDLLPPDVQRLFRALGVFIGGWSLESAEAIDDDPAGTVVRLETLLEHHLVQRLDDVGDRPRYGMLETIREYALERAEAAGEAPALRWRHVRIMAALVQHEEPEVLSARRPAAQLRLGAERANLRAALRHVSTAGDEGVALWADLVSRLGWWWYFDDGLREGEECTAPLLDRLGGTEGGVNGAITARCWTTGARVAFYRGANEVARQRSARAVELAREAGDAQATAHERQAQINLQVARATGDRFREGAGLHLLARVALARGEAQRALAFVRDNIVLQVERGNLGEAVEIARWLAFLHWRRGEHDAAARLLGACGPPGPVTPFLLLLGPERVAQAAQVQRELPGEMPPERWQSFSAEGAALGLERMLGLVSEPVA